MTEMKFFRRLGCVPKLSVTEWSWFGLTTVLWGLYESIEFASSGHHAVEMS
ncbi:MAG: hypothetical protein ACJAR2_002429 [Ilumatobacter sp.]|jgi:hypothetical protein